MATFVVNRIKLINPSQTTTRLIQSFLQAGERVALTDVLSLAVHSPSDIRAHAVVLEPSEHVTAQQVCADVQTNERSIVQLCNGGGPIILRTSPGRDLDCMWAHRFALEAARLIRDAGVRVVNDPVALQRASSKLYGACLPPELTPRTLVAHKWSTVREFVDQHGRVVVKPLLGSGGRDVFFVDAATDNNVRQLCELMGRTGYLVVQEFLPEASYGDCRVLILDGKILRAGDAVAAVRRVPRAGELRSNVSLGARAQPTQLEDNVLHNAERAGKLIAADGIRFAGLDMIGDRIVEVNVYSTGGLVDAEEFYGADFASLVRDHLRGA